MVLHFEGIIVCALVQYIDITYIRTTYNLRRKKILKKANFSSFVALFLLGN